MHHPLNSQPSPRMIWISLSRIKATRVEDPDETPAAIIALLLQVLPEVASKANGPPHGGYHGGQVPPPPPPPPAAGGTCGGGNYGGQPPPGHGVYHGGQGPPPPPHHQQQAVVTLAKALLLPPHQQQAVFLAVVTMAVKANPLLLLGTVDSLLAEYIRINLTIPILIPVAKVGKATISSITNLPTPVVAAMCTNSSSSITTLPTPTPVAMCTSSSSRLRGTGQGRNHR
mmetsp:Transcript_8155/g.16599  ORF Transcript_8155/g.16599 Transcript_8155/m.16599 type:complete len:228 (-) Transcript_8155:1585-2268(-)